MLSTDGIKPDRLGTHHSGYDGKSRRTCQTFSIGESISTDVVSARTALLASGIRGSSVLLMMNIDKTQY